MAVLEILKYPDPRLRIKAEPITTIDDALLRKIDDLYETMYASEGIGLAATQVNYHLRVFTMDLSNAHNEPRAILNPELIYREGEQLEGEACLSVGGNAFDTIKRAQKVRLRGMSLDGKIFEIDAEGLMAACFQHEIDHLNGILFIDHLSRLKQERIRKKIEKERRLSK